MNGGHDADEEIESDAVSYLESWRERLGTDARDTRLRVRLVGKGVVQVVGQLAVNADRLHPQQYAVSGALQHECMK